MNDRMNLSGKRVVVGLTGRVDSAVAAFLLKKQGMQVIGVTLVTTNSNDFSEEKYYPRCHVRDLEKVKAFCEALQIPFYATDGKSQFANDVLDPHVANKMLGKSNIACFNCTNMRIKVLFEKMKVLKADFIATGHYCKIHQNLNSDQYFIHTNNHKESDQSYMLSGVEEKYLKHLLLPLGELRRDEVEKIAKKFNLSITDAPQRDKICFKEIKSYESYVNATVPKNLHKVGQVSHIETETFYGDHKGLLNHYITEDKLKFTGLTPADKKMQIVKYDYKTGSIYLGDKKSLTFKGGQLVDLNLNSGLDKSGPIHCFVKTKYTKEPVKANLFFKNNDTALIELEEEIYPMIIDEIFVIYDKITRNAKVIGYGKLLKRGVFNLVDRVADFRVHEVGIDGEIIEDSSSSNNSIFKF